MINKIGSTQSTCNFSSRKIDEEHRRIIEKLYRKYGIRSTGNKTSDKAILREKEIIEAESLSSPNGDFVVLSRSEVEKIIEKKKKKKTDANSDFLHNQDLGQKILAEQMMVYMQMNSNNIQ